MGMTEPQFPTSMYYVLCFVPGLLVLCWWQARRAFRLASWHQDEHARTLRLLGRHLHEPLYSVFGFGLLYGFFYLVQQALSGITFIYHLVSPFQPFRHIVPAIALLNDTFSSLYLFIGALFVFPAIGWLLSTPHNGYSQPYQAIVSRLFAMGVARLMALLAAAYLVFVNPTLLLLPTLAWLVLVGYLGIWSRKLLRGAFPTRSVAVSPVAPTQAARPAGGPRFAPVAPLPSISQITGNLAYAVPATPGPTLAPSVAQPPVQSAAPLPTVDLLTSSVHMVHCPVCATLVPIYAEDCSTCGLLFNSRVPAALRSLPDYHVLRPLGDGGMSSTYLARKHPGERLCVLKTLATVDSQVDPEWRAEAARCLHNEYAMLKQLDHPHIARVLSWVSRPQTDLLVLEYVPGPTLEQRLTRLDGQGNTVAGAPLPVAEALDCAETVVGVLEYLAELPQPVVHHDIKPSNLILRSEDGALVLVDFGGAVPQQGDPTHPVDGYGTPGYAAPELYQGGALLASDMYALGATLYHLLTDDDPTQHPLSFPQLDTLAPELVWLLQPMLASSPHERPTPRQFRRALARVRADL